MVSNLLGKYSVKRGRIILVKKRTKMVLIVLHGFLMGRVMKKVEKEQKLADFCQNCLFFRGFLSGFLFVEVRT